MQPCCTRLNYSFPAYSVKVSELMFKMQVKINVMFLLVLQEFCGAIALTEEGRSRWFMERIQVICAGNAEDNHFKKKMWIYFEKLHGQLQFCTT